MKYFHFFHLISMDLRFSINSRQRLFAVGKQKKCWNSFHVESQGHDAVLGDLHHPEDDFLEMIEAFGSLFELFHCVLTRSAVLVVKENRKISLSIGKLKKVKM